MSDVQSMPVTVKWGKDRFEFELPQNNTPLATIRNLIATYTHLPFHDFSIVHDGAIMKDDNAPSNFFYLLFFYHLLVIQYLSTTFVQTLRLQ
jgi:hypothetical protein